LPLRGHEIKIVEMYLIVECVEACCCEEEENGKNDGLGVEGFCHAA